MAYIAHVGDLIGQLDETRLWGERCCVFDLELFALLFGQGFVVGDLEHESEDVCAESGFELGGLGLGIFEDIVQEGGLEGGDVFDSAAFGQEERDGERMVDVGCCGDILAPLIAMFVRGERGGVEDRVGVWQGHGVVVRSGVWRF